MHQRYQDAMTIVREYKKLDLFVTFTYNSNWSEIKNSLKYGEKSTDRPILVNRIFWIKFKEFLNDVKSRAFGNNIHDVFNNTNT